MLRTLLAFALLAAPAAAQDIRPADIPRFQSLDAITGTALRAAFAGGSPRDTALLAQALAGQATGEIAAEGDWSCRTLKLGGLLPLTVYPPFKCRITRTAPGVWALEKLTGSQRLSGTIRERDDGAFYAGVGFVEGGPAATYDQLPPEQVAVDPGQTHPQVGMFEQAGPNQARLLLPAPLFESELDILWLTR